MVKSWVLSNLNEAREELDRIIAELTSGEVSEEELSVWFEHLYHHINVAWNTRHLTGSQIDQGLDLSSREFIKWRQFPTDLDMGSPT